jgi:hypothetical protein
MTNKEKLPEAGPPGSAGNLFGSFDFSPLTAPRQRPCKHLNRPSTGTLSTTGNNAMNSTGNRPAPQAGTANRAERRKAASKGKAKAARQARTIDEWREATAPEGPVLVRREGGAA